MCKTMASSGILSFLGSGPARRTLFGPVDREQLQRDYQEALRKHLEEASQRWGFDFSSEQPLEGSDFQWEAVSGTDVPLIYRPRVVSQDMEKTPTVQSNTLKRKQTTITDFYQAKRRASGTALKTQQ